jgi:hypothetical protein
MFKQLLGIIIVDFKVNYWLDILHLSVTGENVTVHQLFIDFWKACHLVILVSHNILTEFYISMKLARLIKMSNF